MFCITILVTLQIKTTLITLILHKPISKILIIITITDSILQYIHNDYIRIDTSIDIAIIMEKTKEEIKRNK